MNTFPEITTQRCVLRQITNEDIPALRQIIDDKQFMRFLPELYETLKTNDGLKRFFHIFDIYVRNDDGVLWGLSVSGTLIGFIAIIDVSYDPVLFYAVHPQYRNQTSKTLKTMNAFSRMSMYLETVLGSLPTNCANSLKETSCPI